ncbi:MAG: sulfotransferase family protein [Pseudomonadota bacterium]
MTHPIHVLWAVPRSTSTAFEWMMRQRGDLTCFHEPFGEAWYQGEAPLWPRATADSLRTPGLTLESTLQMLLKTAEAGPVFSKDFPHYVDTIWTDAFLAHFNHSFLIRDPVKTVTSITKHWPDVHLKELGFHDQRALFERLWERDGAPPPVIDSDDLLEDPAGIVAAWCEAIGIPFIESALSWEPGARDEVSWWDGGSFHQNLRNSDGLKPQARKYVDIAEASDHAKALYEDVLPCYEALYAHRLKPKGTQ